MAVERTSLTVSGLENDAGSPIRLLICSRYRVLRAGLRLLVETDTRINVVAEADTASTIFAVAQSAAADVILVDDDLYETVPHELWAALHLERDTARVLLLHDEDGNSPNPFRLAVVSKEDAPEALLEAIRKLHAGESLLADSPESHTSTFVPPSVESTTNDSIEWLLIPGPPAKRRTISDKRVIAVLEAVENDLQKSDSIEVLARRVGIGGSRLRHLLRDLVGTSLSQFRKERRLQVAAYLLAHSHKRVSEIAYQVGFSDVAYFDKAFRKRFGTSPTRYRRSNSLLSARLKQS